MRRLTISIDDATADEFDRLVARQGYLSRSESFRDLIRGQLGRDAVARDARGWCVATLSYVFAHHQRHLAGRLNGMQHDHHDLIVSTTHVHLDHDWCLETLLLRGRTAAIRRFADALVAERGVRHGNLHLVPVSGHRHRHVHVKPSA